MLGFGFVLVVQATHVEAAIGRTAHGSSAAGLLATADAVLLLVYYALLVGLYLVRLPPRDGDRRVRIAVASFAGAFLVMAVPLLPTASRRDWLLLPSGVLTLAGIAYTLWALLYLRRSFSILPQARELVTGGPYALSRNPLYLGEIVSSWSVYVPTMALPGVAVLTANVGLQVVRVLAEERVLARHFGPAFAEYSRRVPRFLPRLPRSSPRTPSAWESP